MDNFQLIVTAVRNTCPFLVKEISTIIAKYAQIVFIIDEYYYYGNDFDSYTTIRSGGLWTSFVFVKASTNSFIIGNHFSACNHKTCGAYGDSDCEEEMMMVTVTCNRPPTIVSLNQSLKYMERYVDKNEIGTTPIYIGTTPIYGCLYKISDKVCEKSIKTLRDLGFEGEIPNSDEADDNDEADEEFLI
jgi:hypothetical protein